MHILRLTTCLVAVLLLIGPENALIGQEQQPDGGVAEQAEIAVGLDDPRVVALAEAYQRRVHELREQLIIDMEQLGKVESPKHLEFVEQSSGKWAWRGSTGGFANHSVRVTARDITETPSWPHYLDVPPLDPRSTLRTADETMRKWFADNETTFELRRISLVPLIPNEGKWYWEAVYEVTRGSSDKEFTLAIRMDGKVLTGYQAKSQND